jgi:hypothetical protein
LLPYDGGNLARGSQPWRGFGREAAVASKRAVSRAPSGRQSKANNVGNFNLQRRCRRLLPAS